MEQKQRLDKLGFVGFGEAAYHVAKGLLGEGVGSVYAFDIHKNDPKLGTKIQSRARETGAVMMDSPEALAGAVDVIISAVTADQACERLKRLVPI